MGYPAFREPIFAKFHQWRTSTEMSSHFWVNTSGDPGNLQNSQTLVDLGIDHSSCFDQKTLTLCNCLSFFRNLYMALQSSHRYKIGGRDDRSEIKVGDDDIKKHGRFAWNSAVTDTEYLRDLLGLESWHCFWVNGIGDWLVNRFILATNGETWCTTEDSIIILSFFCMEEGTVSRVKRESSFDFHRWKLDVAEPSHPFRWGKRPPREVHKVATNKNFLRISISISTVYYSIINKYKYIRICMVSKPFKWIKTAFHLILRTVTSLFPSKNGTTLGNNPSSKSWTWLWLPPPSWPRFFFVLVARQWLEWQASEKLGKRRRLLFLGPPGQRVGTSLKLMAVLRENPCLKMA